MKKQRSQTIDLPCIVQTQSREEAYNVNHEIAQPLTTMSIYIGGCITQLTTGIPEKESILRAMNKVIEDIERAQQIISRIQNPNAETSTF